MTTQTATHNRTGKWCVISGVYEFDDYLDGTSYPAHTPQERRESIAQHNVFPPIRSASKGCYRRLLERA
jgi:hypothetical protein